MKLSDIIEEMNEFTTQKESFKRAASEFSGFMAREISEEKRDELSDIVADLNLVSMLFGAEYVLQKTKERRKLFQQLATLKRKSEDVQLLHNFIVTD